MSKLTDYSHVEPATSPAIVDFDGRQGDVGVPHGAHNLHGRGRVVASRAGVPARLQSRRALVDWAEGSYALATHCRLAPRRWISQGRVKNIHRLKERHPDVELQRAEQLDGS